MFHYSVFSGVFMYTKYDKMSFLYDIWYVASFEKVLMKFDNLIFI